MLGQKVSHQQVKVNHPIVQDRKEPVHEESRKKIPNDYDRIRNLIKDEPRKIKK